MNYFMQPLSLISYVGRIASCIHVYHRRPCLFMHCCIWHKHVFYIEQDIHCIQNMTWARRDFDKCFTSSLLSAACIYASVNRVSIGSDNGLSPIRCQAIIWNSAGLLSIGPLRQTYEWNYDQNTKVFILLRTHYEKLYIKSHFLHCLILFLNIILVSVHQLQSLNTISLNLLSIYSCPPFSLWC